MGNNDDARDAERTLSAPDVRATLAQADGIVATIAWHPDRARVGERAAIVAARDGTWSLDRFAPLFYRATGGEGTPLGHRAVSRDALRVRLIDGGGLAITPPASKMACALDGVAFDDTITLDDAAVRRVAFLQLGGRVLIALHRHGAPVPDGTDYGLVGVSDAIVRVRAQLREVARTALPVLLLGESGTGKELAAQAIHAHSRRHAGPLVSINMATLSEALAPAELFGATRGAYTGAQQARRGLFAQAHDGTLFLDEIGDTPAAVQPMLLRMLETGEFRPLGATRDERADVRLVAATDRDLADGFNQPLLRRLAAYTIALPPLRARREDIGVLVAHFLARAEAQQGAAIPFDAPLVDALARAPWPGNVRELAHAVRRLALAPPDDRAITLAELLAPPAAIAPSASIARSPQDAATTPVIPANAGTQRLHHADRRATDTSDTADTADTPRSRRTRHRDPATITDDDVFTALDACAWCVRDAAAHLGLSRTSFYALLERSERVRRIDDVPLDEINAALREAPGDPSRWAALLRTPRESLRRRIRSLGLLPR